MRTIIIGAAIAAVTVATLTGSAEARSKPSIRLVWMDATSSGYTITTIRAKVARTDHHNPKGVKVCVRWRDINSGAEAEAGCRTVDATGKATFERADVVTEGLEYQLHSPTTTRLSGYTAPWWATRDHVV